jgi:uncharacterized protein DUF559
MNRKRLTPISRKLRRASTDAETRLWQRLRNRRLLDFKFRHQMPIGNHVADFACTIVPKGNRTWRQRNSQLGSRTRFKGSSKLPN